MSKIIIVVICASILTGCVCRLGAVTSRGIRIGPTRETVCLDQDGHWKIQLETLGLSLDWKR